MDMLHVYENAPLPPKSPSSTTGVLKINSDVTMNTPDLSSSAPRKHRRSLTRADFASSGGIFDGQQTSLSPLKGKKISLSTKDRSPVAAVDFDKFADEEKFNLDDEVHTLTSFVNQLGLHPLSSETGPYVQGLCRDEGKAKPPTTKEAAARTRTSSPPLPPRRPQLVRSSSDPSAIQEEAPPTEQAMMNLANDCLSGGDLLTALALYESVLQELDRKYGRYHPQVALCVHKIGEAQLFLGNYPEAIAQLASAVSMRSVVLGVFHLDVSESMEKLAIAKLHLNEVGHAHEMYRRALRIKRSNLGLYHADVGHLQTQLACIYFYCQEYISAQSSFEEALDVYQHLAGTDGADSRWTIKLADTLCSVGSIKLEQKCYENAIGYFTNALLHQKQVHGLYHLSVVMTLDNLAFAHCKNKEYELASQFYEEMLLAQTAIGGMYTYECYQTLKKLTHVYEKMGKLLDAIDAALEAVSALKRQEDDMTLRKVKKLLDGLQRREAIQSRAKRFVDA